MIITLILGHGDLPEQFSICVTNVQNSHKHKTGFMLLSGPVQSSIRGLQS